MHLMDQGLIAQLTVLLYQHDCVIIPGFGGFLMQSRNTMVDQARQQALPPCRNIRFNSLLKDDDGLLSSSLAMTGKTGYADARSRIDAFTRNGWEVLWQGKPWILEGIGTFTLNSENGLNFEPDPVETFLASSFGLSPVTASTMQAPRPAARLARKPADRQPERTRKPVPVGARRMAIVSLPIIAFLLWGIISPFQADFNYGSYAGFLIRYSATVKPVQPPTGENRVISADLQSTSLPEDPKPAKPLVDNATPEDRAESIPAETAIPSGPRYYIIGGAFLNHDNANKFMEALKSRGYNAEAAGTTRTGQLRISYGSFPLMDDAIIFLNKIRKEENPSAWILKY